MLYFIERTSNLMLIAEMAGGLAGIPTLGGLSEVQFFVDFLPTGQGMRMAYLRVVHPIRMIFSSVFLTVFGMFLFEKKDLK